MAFRIGQRVVCIDGDWNECDGEIVPVKGEVYTIREICDFRGLTGLRLVEIVNSPDHYEGGIQECMFNALGFRPVKTTSIEVFRRMLAPVPA